MIQEQYYAYALVRGWQIFRLHDTDAESTISESEGLDDIMGNADESIPSIHTMSIKRQVPEVSVKVMTGHYIASVRNPDGPFSNIEGSI